MTTNAPSVQINGQPQLVSRGDTVADALRRIGIDVDSARGIAVAVNDEVIHRDRWSATPLEEGDRMEIITARQGG
jgi:sulfur carrier protein